MKNFIFSSSIDFGFKQTKESFFVEEIPRNFRQKGRYAIVKVRKQGVTTWEMVASFARYLNVSPQSIGYAGLKDKNATTIQYLSFDARMMNNLKRFHHKAIEILDIIKDDKSIRMGDLKANRFKILLDRIDEKKVGLIEKNLHKIAKVGLPNYFGYQRFGKDTLSQAKAFIDGEYFTKDNKLKKFLIAAYQSDLFNRWLCERVGLEDGRFKLLEGDLYTDGNKLFTPKDIPLKDFLAQKIVPTGLLPGQKVFLARDEARKIEKKYDTYLPYPGSRRPAVVFPKIIRVRFLPKRAQVLIEFELPKGSYATILLENLAGKELSKEGF